MMALLMCVGAVGKSIFDRRLSWVMVWFDIGHSVFFIVHRVLFFPG